MICLSNELKIQHIDCIVKNKKEETGMKTKRFTALGLVTVVTAATALTACGGGSGSTSADGRKNLTVF